MIWRRYLALTAALVLSAACGTSPGQSGDMADGSVIADAGPHDGGTTRTPDAGLGEMDAGSPTRDAGTPDAGMSEKTDAGTSSTDAGTATPDAGTATPDAGTSPSDAGTSASDAGTSQAHDAGSAPPPVTVGWCDVQWPVAIPDEADGIPLPRAGQLFGTIYAQVYSAGVTTVGGNQGEFAADIGYGPPESQPAGDSQWTWIPATFNTNCTTCGGNNYEYLISLTAPGAGAYNYASRFSADGRQTYQYCAGAGTQGGMPYQPQDAYTMEVAGNGCQGTGDACGTGNDCCSSSCGAGLCQPAAPQCNGGQSLCGGNCVDTTSDPDNCGSCGDGCFSQVCVDSNCSCLTRGAECSSGANCCSGSCESSSCQCVGPGGYCATDYDCCPGTGGVCENGHCGFIPPGGACSADAGGGCQPPFLCLNDTCQAVCLPAGQPYGAAGPAACCGNGGDGSCGGCSTAGCQTDADCCSGSGPCVGGSCSAGCIPTGAALPDNQESCNSATATECCSGSCINGTYPTCSAPVCPPDDWR